MTGRILRNVRKLRGYTQAKMGKKMNVAENTISNYENEISSPTFETAIKLLKECDFDIQFVDRKKNKIYTLEELSIEMDF